MSPRTRSRSSILSLLCTAGGRGGRGPGGCSLTPLQPLRCSTPGLHHYSHIADCGAGQSGLIQGSNKMPRGSISEGDDESEVGSTISASSGPTFSVFSLTSTKSTKPNSFSTMASCIKTSIKWRAKLLGKKKKPVIPGYTLEMFTLIITSPCSFGR